MQLSAAANWLCVALFCTDAHALQAPALRQSVTVASKSHQHSGLAAPVAVRAPSVAMISPGWRIAAVTTGASSVVSTVVAVREWRGRRRALRQVDDLNATVLSLNSGLQRAAERQANTDAALSQVRARGEAARVYGLQMADALEREQTARRGELVFKAKEARHTDLHPPHSTLHPPSSTPSTLSRRASSPPPTSSGSGSCRRRSSASARPRRARQRRASPSPPRSPGSS